jgi:hypothetical protein
MYTFYLKTFSSPSTLFKANCNPVKIFRHKIGENVWKLKIPHWKELKSVAEQTSDKGLAMKSIFTRTAYSPCVYLNSNFHLRLIVHDLKLINFNFLCKHKHDGYVSNLISFEIYFLFLDHTRLHGTRTSWWVQSCRTQQFTLRKM